MAVLVISSSLGEIRKNRLSPPCAPKGVNHGDFFNERRKPDFYFVAKIYGHVDMLDDETKEVRRKDTYCLCKNGKAREATFLKGYLDRDFGAGFGGYKKRSMNWFLWCFKE